MEQYRQTEEIKSAEVKAYYIPARAKEEIYHNYKNSCMCLLQSIHRQ